MRTLSGGQRERASAVLLVDDETAMLSIVDGGDPTAKPLPPNGLRAPTRLALPADCWIVCATTGSAEDVYLIGKLADVSGIAESSRQRLLCGLRCRDDPDFAIARGAAMAAEAATGGLSYPAGT